MTLLEETSITLTELDNMDPWRKYKYYFFISHKNEEEMRMMKDKNKNDKGKARTLRGDSL